MIANDRRSTFILHQIDGWLRARNETFNFDRLLFIVTKSTSWLLRNNRDVLLVAREGSLSKLDQMEVAEYTDNVTLGLRTTII